jgi:hypothetical protein
MTRPQRLLLTPLLFASLIAALGCGTSTRKKIAAADALWDALEKYKAVADELHAGGT